MPGQAIDLVIKIKIADSLRSEGVETIALNFMDIKTSTYFGENIIIHVDIQQAKNLRGSLPPKKIAAKPDERINMGQYFEVERDDMPLKYYQI